LLTGKSKGFGKLTQNTGITLLFGIIFIAVTMRAPFTSVGPLINMIREDTGISSALAGMLTTLPLIAFAVFSLVAPKVARRIGIEYTLFAGLIILTLGILLRTIPLLSGLMVGTTLIGVAIAVANVLLPSLIKREFPERSGIMTGVYSIVMNLSAAVGLGMSIPLAHIEGLGWRGSLVCWSVISVIAILVWLPQLRFRKPVSSIDAKASGTSSRMWKSALAWQVTLFMGIQSCTFYVLVAWLPDMLHEQGMSIAQGGWMLSLLQLSTVPASFLTPVLAARCSDQRFLGAIVGLMFLIGFLGLIMGPLVFVPLWMVLIGTAGGASISLSLLLFGLRTANSEQAAQLSGMAQSIGYLLAAMGPLLMGFIYDMTEHWLIPLVILAVLSIPIIIFGMAAGQNQVVFAKERSHLVKHKSPYRDSL
jgi:CP family cyanate transporter-like MFS transporter